MKDRAKTGDSVTGLERSPIWPRSVTPHLPDAPACILAYTGQDGKPELYLEVMKMHILLADNRARVRYALRALLEQSPGLQVVSEAMDAHSLLVQAKAVLPDLVLLDWELRGLAPADLMPTLRRICPGLAVVVLSGRPEARRAAIDAGADAFVSKTDPPDRLLAAIKDCQRKKPPLPRKE